MIYALSAVVPKSTVDRSGFNVEQLKSFERVTGIKKTRKFSGSSTELALLAVSGLKEGLNRQFIGAIIVVTQSPDRLSPAMAHDIAKYVGVSSTTPVFDVNQSCTGFIYGLWLSSVLYQFYGSVLLVCVDKLKARSGLDSLIFSDASVACIINKQLSFTDSFKFHTDPSGADKLHSDKEGYLCMSGGDVFDFVTKNIPGMIREFETEDVLVQHQANLSMMKLVDKRSGFQGRSIHTIHEYGNMSMCSIPVALASRVNDLRGKTVVLAGYGAGWSAAITSTLYDPSLVRLVEV